jgi:hypothetical protein
MNGYAAARSSLPARVRRRTRGLLADGEPQMRRLVDIDPDGRFGVPVAYGQTLFLLMLLSLLTYVCLPLTWQFKLQDEGTLILPLGVVFAFVLVMATAIDLVDENDPRALTWGVARLHTAALARIRSAVAMTATALVAGSYVAIVYDKGFPVSEGWFSVFARYVNAGKVPYRDFELLATPAYTYLIAAITRVFGYDLIVLRVVGALLFVGIAVVAYLVFSRLFRPAIALIAAGATALFMQSEVANVFYDYVRFFDLFAYGACLSLLIYVGRCDRPSRRRLSLAITTCGLCSGLALLVRQNSGALVAAYVVVLFVFLAFVVERRKALLLNLVNYVVGLLVPVTVMVGVMVANGSLGAFRRMTVTDALAAKGGLVTTLFAWVGRAARQALADWRGIALLLALLVVHAVLYLRERDRRHELDRDEGAGLRVGLLFAVPALAGIFLCYQNLQLSHLFAPLRGWQTPYSVYAVVLVLFVVSVVRVRHYRTLEVSQRRSRLLFLALTGMVVALGYGAGTSGGLSEGQTALGLGTILATILYLGDHRRAAPTQLVAVALSVCLCLSFVAYKYEHPYAWWGLSEPDVRLATETFDLPLLRGIAVSPWTKSAVEGIAGDITAHSQPTDSVFVFPHIPIFYLLSDRYPSTFTLVQWYDFSSPAGVRADIRTLQKDPPKVIVIARVPTWVTAAHESLFGDGRAQLQMLTALQRLVSVDGYRRVGTYMIDTGYQVVVYAAR